MYIVLRIYLNVEKKVYPDDISPTSPTTLYSCTIDINCGETCSLYYI